MRRPVVALASILALCAAGTCASADGERKLPEFLAGFQDCLARPGKDGIRGIAAKLHWKSENSWETEAKSTVGLKGLEFDVRIDPPDEGSTQPKVTATLKNPPKGAAPGDVELLQYHAASQVAYAYEDPLPELQEFLASEDARMEIDEKNRTLTATRKGGEGVFFVQLVFRVAPDDSFLEVVRVGDEGIMDRRSYYQYLWKGSHRVLAGEYSGGAPGVWKGTQRVLLYGTVDDIPVLQRVFDVSHDDSAKVPQETCEIEVTDVRVEKD